MQLGTIEGEVDTSAFKFRAVEDVGKFDFVSVKSNDRWILAQVEEVTKKPDGETFAEANIIGYRDKGLTKAPRQVIEPDSIVYEADQELIADTLGLEDAGLHIGNLETNPDIDIFVDESDFYKHFAVLAQTGAGKCVTPDTQVLMADGVTKPISDVFEEYKDAVVREDGDEELVLLSDCSVKSIDDSYNQTDADAILGYRKKAENVLRFTLESGREVEVTPEHPLMSAEKSHGFVQAEEISEGDHVAVPRRIETQNTSEITLSEKTSAEAEIQNEKRRNAAAAYEQIQDIGAEKSLKSISNETGVNKSTLDNWLYKGGEPRSEGFALSDNAKGIEVPEKFDERLAEFLSLIIAEGTEQQESSYRIIFTNDNKRLTERFEDLSRDLFGLEARNMQGRARYIDSTSLKPLLEEMGYSTLKKSRAKEIPALIQSADKTCLKTFLRTFYDCEGCMEDHEITLSSASESIASDLAYMLLEFGIVARLRQKERTATNSNHGGDTYYEVVISGAEKMHKFAEQIGFGMERKQKKLENYLSSVESNTNTDVIPLEGEHLKKARLEKDLSQRELAERIGSHSTLVSLYERNERRPSKRKFEKMSEVLEDSKMTRLTSSDVFWDKVESIERIEHNDYVYDLTVREHHNFIAGSAGIVCHNSYLSGVLIEELLEQDFPILILDPHGEYSSLEIPNPESGDEKSKGYDVKKFSPNTDVNSEAMPLRFSSLNMEKKELLEVIPDSLTNSQMGVLYNALKRLREKDEDYTLNDIMDAVSQEDSTAKWNLLNSMEQIEESGLFSETPTNLKDLLEPGRATIVNLKAVEPEATEMTAYLLAKRLFDLRKRDRVPPFIMLMEEAHNFAPEQGFGKALSSEILRKIASEGRKFGLGIGVVSQRPARIDKNVLSQCNTQFILRVSNPNDLKAISKSFEGVTSEVESMITSLPPGVCFVLGNEYPVMTEVRKRYSKHGGTTQTAEDYEEKTTVKCYKPQEDIDDVRQRYDGSYSIAYYPLYHLENEEKELLVDGVKGDIKAERTKPSGIEKKVLEKMREGLNKSEIIKEVDMTVTKMSSVQESLSKKGLIEQESFETKESVLDIELKEEDATEEELIEYQVDEESAKSKLDDAELRRLRYPYYSSGDSVYDPILKKEL